MGISEGIPFAMTVSCSAIGCIQMSHAVLTQPQPTLEPHLCVTKDSNDGNGGAVMRQQKYERNLIERIGASLGIGNVILRTH